MRIVERYIFVRIGGATAMTFVALGAMVWLSQALRQFDLVTANGQSLWIFFKVSALLMPALASVVLPVALMIGVVYTLASLNTDSELVVINASGASQMTILRPVLALGMIVTLAVGTMSLYFTPLSLRSWQDLITNVRGDILTEVLQEGEFTKLAPGLTFHMRERSPDGSLGGIFLSDSRDSETNLTYLAERGGILQNPLGTFLIMGNGTIQQRNTTDGAISMIEFSSYAFDLTSFASSSDNERTTTAGERTTGYLVDPDPDDRYLRQYPNKFRLEIHKRLTFPLYSLTFALLPLAFLGQAESARQGRAAGISAAVFLTAAVQSVGIFLPGVAESSRAALIAMYVLPLGVAALAATLVLMGKQLKPPDRAAVFVERVFVRAGGALRGGTTTPTG